MFHLILISKLTFLCWQKLLRCLYLGLLQLFVSKKILYSLHRNLVIWKGTKYFHFYEHKTMIYWCWYDIKFYSDWKYFWNAADEWTHVKIQSTLYIFVKTIDKRSPHYVTGTFLAYIICSVKIFYLVLWLSVSTKYPVLRYNRPWKIELVQGTMKSHQRKQINVRNLYLALLLVVCSDCIN